MTVSKRDLEAQRREFTTRIATALTEEDDPLALYVQFVQWIIKNYAENDPDAGLAHVLKQATETFKGDATYKTDLRYLKLWVLYARQTDLPTAINMYASLAKMQIGVSYSLLYEEYAKSLERVGRIGDAEQIYRTGIKRQVRPLERLKTNYNNFKARNAVTAPPVASSSKASPTPRSAPSSPTSVSSAASRYATMLVPPAPGKRPEMLKYDASLLWTADGVEYCAAEARARTMGLLGKKWTPLPITTLATPAKTASSHASARVVFDDDEETPKRNSANAFGRRKSIMGGGEPTVTINTKEALADVFSMYNSPEKTMRLAKPGSKHAPIKNIVAFNTPKQAAPQFPPEPQTLSRSQNSSFRPYVDESGLKENHAAPKPTPKFAPFVDSLENNKTPSSKSVISSTFAPPVTPANSLPQTERPSENVFSRVFTPVASKTPLRDMVTEAHGKPQAKPFTHERAKSFQDISSAPFSEPHQPSPFAPFHEKQKTPFKVFSRPADSENAFTPKSSAFTPSAKPTFTPYRDEPAQPLDSLQVLQPEVRHSPVSAESTPSTSDFGTEDYNESEPSAEPEDEDDYGSSYVEDEYEQPINDHDYETPEETDGYAEYEDDGGGGGGYSVPLGGRFGQFNVMTPITERTIEYTSTRSVFATPSDRDRPDDIEEQEDEDADQYVLDHEGMEEVEEDWNPGASVQPWMQISQIVDDTTPDVEALQEQTGQLSLAEALTLSSNFRPANPCNPFESSIMSTCLSLMPSDAHFYDLRHSDANLLDGLQKFAKKLRKTSGGSNHGATDMSASFPLALDGQKFRVVDKLGEGGFGAVFHAQSIEARDDEDDTDMDFDDDDEEDTKMVALKVVRPRNLWEYHVLRRLHSTLPKARRLSVVLPHALFAFHDESFLVLEYCSQGTLLSVVNKAASAGVSQQGAGLDELLVIFFTVELTRLLESMHEHGFIHGDLKIDNCLLRLEDVPGGGSAWDSAYNPSGDNGWSCKGIKLIDFGRTINTRLFPAGQQFVADWPSDDRDCFEIREHRPWTYQTDYFGLAGVVYCLLFGKYIQASSVAMSGGRYRIATPFKRYWQTEMWEEFFDMLLNPGEVENGGGKLPITAELGDMRRGMEMWLQSNCNRTSGTLKGLLKKVEMSCLR